MIELPNIKAVLFDMDGTLIDSELFYFKAWIRVLQPLDLHFSADDWLKKMAGKTTVQVFEDLKQNYGLQIEWELFFKNIRDAVAQQYLQDEVELMPGAKDLLSILRDQGMRMAVVTSSYRVVAERHLSNLGILDFFEFLVTRDDVSNPKPDPEPYLLALKQMGLKSSEVIALEDSVPGIQAVREASVFAIAVQPHALLRAQLKADLVLTDLLEFKQHFQF